MWGLQACVLPCAPSKEQFDEQPRTGRCCGILQQLWPWWAAPVLSPGTEQRGSGATECTPGVFRYCRIKSGRGTKVKDCLRNGDRNWSGGAVRAWKLLRKKYCKAAMRTSTLCSPQPPRPTSPLQP